MHTISVTNFRKDAYNIINQTVKFNEPIQVTAKDGNAVIISEKDYNSFVETIFLSSVPGLKQSLLNENSAPEKEFVDSDEVKW